MKSLYDDLKLREAYAKYEEAAHGDILGLIQQLRHGADKGNFGRPLKECKKVLSG